MIELIGFLFLVLALAIVVLVASISVRRFVQGYLLRPPANERFSDRWREDYSTRQFNQAYDVRRSALLEAERRRRAEGEFQATEEYKRAWEPPLQ